MSRLTRFKAVKAYLHSKGQNLSDLNRMFGEWKARFERRAWEGARAPSLTSVSAMCAGFLQYSPVQWKRDRLFLAPFEPKELAGHMAVTIISRWDGFHGDFAFVLRDKNYPEVAKINIHTGNNGLADGGRDAVVLDLIEDNTRLSLKSHHYLGKKATAILLSIIEEHARALGFERIIVPECHRAIMSFTGVAADEIEKGFDDPRLFISDPGIKSEVGRLCSDKHLSLLREKVSERADYLLGRLRIHVPNYGPVELSDDELQALLSFLPFETGMELGAWKPDKDSHTPGTYVPNSFLSCVGYRNLAASLMRRNRCNYETAQEEIREMLETALFKGELRENYYKIVGLFYEDTLVGYTVNDQGYRVKYLQEGYTPACSSLE